MTIPGLPEYREEAKKVGTTPFTEPTENPISTCGEFMAVKHPDIDPLIGTPSDALLVRGEGMVLPGQGGVGKTMFLNDLACKLVLGNDILRWRVHKQLRVLYCQAELPSALFQQRYAPLIQSYQEANDANADKIKENLFIMEVKKPFDIASQDVSGLEILAEQVTERKADVVIIDPFLSFFLGNENDNGEVRRSLDNLKRIVGTGCQVGIIISDHMPKYSDSAKNPEQAASMRGAGAKRDWAAAVIALSKMKTPQGQYGTFIRATVDKMRYGKLPRDPFNVRRDDFNFRHEVFRGDAIDLMDIANLLNDNGGEQNKTPLLESIQNTFEVSRLEAQKLIDNCEKERLIAVIDGPRRAKIHVLGEGYIDS